MQSYGVWGTVQILFAIVGVLRVGTCASLTSDILLIPMSGRAPAHSQFKRCVGAAEAAVAKVAEIAIGTLASLVSNRMVDHWTQYQNWCRVLQRRLIK